jgi:hypothetical protein
MPSWSVIFWKIANVTVGLMAANIILYQKLGEIGRGDPNGCAGLLGEGRSYLPSYVYMYLENITWTPWSLDVALSDNNQPF